MTAIVLSTARPDLETAVRAFRESARCDAVVLATTDGAWLAHDLSADGDAARVAIAASRDRAPGSASAFVDGPGGATLVVFLDA